MKFILGLLIGIGIAGGVAFYLNKAQNPFVDKGFNGNSSSPISYIKNSSQPLVLAPGIKMQEASSAPIASPKPAASTPTNYDFYDVLQGKKNLQSQSASAPSTNVAKVKHYALQVGAFSDPDLANDMKAKLALLGFNVKIQSQQNNGKFINRVTIGPVDTNEQAQDLQNQLKQQDISSTIITLN